MNAVQGFEALFLDRSGFGEELLAQPGIAALSVLDRLLDEIYLESELLDEYYDEIPGR